MTGIEVKHKNAGWFSKTLTQFKRLAGKEIAVGFPKGKAGAYPDGQSVIEVAAKNCFGIGVPRRDFMAESKMTIADGTKPLIREAMLASSQGKNKVTNAMLEAAGQKGADIIKETIRDGDWQPNSEVTIARKGSSKPLIDTGRMLGAVTYQVRDKQ